MAAFWRQLALEELELTPAPVHVIMDSRYPTVFPDRYGQAWLEQQQMISQPNPADPNTRAELSHDAGFVAHNASLTVQLNGYKGQVL